MDAGCMIAAIGGASGLRRCASARIWWEAPWNSRRRPAEAPSCDCACRRRTSAQPRKGRMPKLSVLLADDHALVRRGFRRLLEDDPDIEVVGEASRGDEAVSEAARLQPD